MKFFLAGLGNSFYDVPLLAEAFQQAEALDFSGVLIPDHYMWGSRNGERPRRFDDYVTMDSWVMLTYLAAKTDSIRLGTRVTPIPFRPPGILAKMVATLDLFSKGRVIVGVGAGWSQEEFEGYSEWNSPKVRVDKTIEGLELIVKLWTEDEVTHEGGHYSAKKAVLEPKPIQKPYPTLLFGSRGTRMLQLAGRYGNIIYIPNHETPEAYNDKKQIVLKVAKRLNRTKQIEFMAGPMVSTGVYNTQAYFRQIEAAIQLGAHIFQVAFPRDDTLIDSIKRFARDVMPSFT